MPRSKEMQLRVQLLLHSSESVDFSFDIQTLRIDSEVALFFPVAFSSIQNETPWEPIPFNIRILQRAPSSHGPKFPGVFALPLPCTALHYPIPYTFFPQPLKPPPH